MLRRAINREKFPRELDKSRVINSMKHSVLHATAVHAIDFGYIQGAWRCIDALHSTKTDPVESPTVSELEEPLGESGRKVEPIRKKLEEPDLSNRTCPRRFRPWETVGHGKDAMLRCQYKQLRVLEALDVPGLRVPNTFALLPANRLLLIEFVTEKTIETLALPESHHYHKEKD